MCAISFLFAHHAVVDGISMPVRHTQEMEWLRFAENIFLTKT